MAGRDEQEFNAEELFFSTTDHRGVILSGNRVFARVSGYPPGELIGRPHSLVRHPSMPRVVFATLWETVQAGGSIAAYVRNRTRDGASYDVVATVFPVPGGYLSIRFKPSTPLAGTVWSLYEELRAAELAVEDAGGRKRDGIEASRARLDEALHGLGLDGYGAFKRMMLPTEVAARQRIIVAEGLADAAPDAVCGARAGLYESLWCLRSWLRDLLLRLDAFGALAARLSERSDQVGDMAGRVSLLALNGLIAAQHHGSSGSVLGVVAGLLRDRARMTAGAGAGVRTAIAAARDRLGVLAYDIAVACLQADMAVTTLIEMAAREDAVEAGRRWVGTDVQALAGCLNTAVGSLLAALDQVDSGIHALSRQVDDLRLTLGPLEALQTQGRVEAAREDGVGDFALVFAQVAETTGLGTESVADLERVVREVDVRGDVGALERARAGADRVLDEARALQEPAVRIAA